MTTGTTTHPTGPRSGPGGGTTRLLLRAAATTALLGLLGAAVAALVAGGPGAVGVLVGTTLAVVVLLGGSLAVDAVAGVLPAASLLVALLTFALQVLVVLLVLLALERSGSLGVAVDRTWLGVTVIVATLLWLAVQVRLHVTTRVPVWDTPAGEAAEAPRGVTDGPA